MNFLRNILQETGLVGGVKDADVTDPEMDAAIATMRHRLAKLRQQRKEDREQNSLEQEVLRGAYEKSKQRLYDRLDVQKLVQNAPLMLYMTATKQVRDYLVPGVVAKLQAELCLHVHALCMHNEQLVRQQHDADIMVWWYEDMRKQLRNDQSQLELELMNQMVKTKMELGDLVDAKKLRAQREPRRQISSSISRRNSSSIRGIPRRMISHTSTNKDNNSMRSARSGLRSTISNKENNNGMQNQQQQQQPRRRSSLLKAQQHGSVITLEDIKNDPEHLPAAVTTSMEHQRLRVVRTVSRPGTALQNPKLISTKVTRRSITMVMSMTRMALGANANAIKSNSDDSNNSSCPFLDGDDWTDTESENEDEDEEEIDTSYGNHHHHLPGLYATSTAHRDGGHDHLSMSEKTADSTSSSVVTETAIVNKANMDGDDKKEKDAIHKNIGSSTTTTKKKNSPPKKAYTGIEDMINESSRHRRRERRRRRPANKTKAMEDGSSNDIQTRRAARAKARAAEKEMSKRCTKINTDNMNDKSSSKTSNRQPRGTRDDYARNGVKTPSTKTSTTTTTRSTTRSRPIQRGVVRTRSKSLTEMGRGRRAGRKTDVSPQRQQPEQPQEQVSGGNKSADHKARAIDDSDIATSTTAAAKRRSSFFRGFTPAPELLALAADMEADGDDDDENIQDNDTLMQGQTTTFRRSFKLEQQCCTSWVG